MRLLPNEHEFQATLCALLQYTADPELFWFAIPNGGARHIAVAKKLQAEGVKPGVPDLCFLLPGGRTAWLEMKIAGGRLSPDQKVFRNYAFELGHPWAMATTLNEATDFLASVGALKGTPK
jgi:hypothetical protein